ncbi:MAG: PEP/pyruvate-binding domain-containing protein, partial [Patescibacteria group bacterium]
GGKGASLGEMSRAGIPVPPGFVVLASAFEDFIKKNHIDIEIDAQLKKVNVKKISTVEKVSKFLRGIIGRYKVPEGIAKEILSAFDKLKAKYVAVRSSATAEDSKVASWAGELESYLGVDRKQVVETVKKCWSSLFTPRAIFYRIEKKLHGKEVSIAVVVQKMIESEVAGVAFTVHPVTRDPNQMVIEASWGLGESVVSGQVTPDTYVVEKPKTQSIKSRTKSKFQILDINVNEQRTKIIRVGAKTKTVKISKSEGGKQCLSNQKIIELAEICKKIEDHYGFPCDIEWALEKGKIYIVQSRPITTL